jgi:hypothetical protein
MKVYVIFGQVKWEESVLLFIYEDVKKAKRRLTYLRKRLSEYYRKDAMHRSAYDSYELEEYEVIK